MKIKFRIIISFLALLTEMQTIEENNSILKESIQEVMVLSTPLYKLLNEKDIYDGALNNKSLNSEKAISNGNYCSNFIF